MGVGAVAGIKGGSIRPDVIRAYKDHTHGFGFPLGLEIGEGEAGIEAAAHPVGDPAIGWEFRVQWADQP